MLRFYCLLTVIVHCFSWEKQYTVQGQPRIWGQFVCRFCGLLFCDSSFWDSLLTFGCFGSPDLHPVTAQANKTATFLSPSSPELCINLEVCSGGKPYKCKSLLVQFPSFKDHIPSSFCLLLRGLVWCKLFSQYWNWNITFFCMYIITLFSRRSMETNGSHSLGIILPQI